jgi:hypothetical protein
MFLSWSVSELWRQSKEAVRMNQSESIAKLADALAKAQGVMEGASKDSSNPFFKSKYADLSAVWDACKKPLSDNGLSVVQTSEFIPDHPDMVCIETMLCHSSGEWIRGRLAVKPVKADPQSVGSCITYLRRYSLQSMVGIAPEDDDGNAASGKEEESPKETRKKKAPAPDPTEKWGDIPKFDPPPNATILASKEQITLIQIKMKEKGITERQDILDALTAFRRTLKKDPNAPALQSSKDLTKEEASSWIDTQDAA